MNSRVRYQIAFGILLLAAAVLRILCARGDLWLDELWSLSFALKASSVFAIVGWHHDNNHLLNTIYLFLCGADRSAVMYRALSIAAGVGFQIAFWKWNVWRSDRERLIGGLLAATSYLMILYGSEARGYSAMLLFEACAAALVWSWLSAPAEWKRWLLALCVLLGLSAHLTFGLFYIALVAATVSRKSITLHRPAILAGGVFAATLLRGFLFGGGNPEPWWRALADFGKYTAGFPQWPLLAIVTGGLVVAEMKQMWRNDRGLFRLCAYALLLPVAAASLLKGEFVHARYFLTALPFLFLILARSTESALRTGGLRQVAVAFVLVIVTAGQLANLRSLYSSGRGQYRAALNFIRAESLAPGTTIGSDHDFRNGLPIRFYGKSPDGTGFRYLSRDQRREVPPEWMIVHSTGAAQPLRLREFSDVPFELVGHYGSAPLSGFSWSIYRRTNTAARASW